MLLSLGLRSLGIAHLSHLDMMENCQPAPLVFEVWHDMTWRGMRWEIIALPAGANGTGPVSIMDASV